MPYHRLDVYQKAYQLALEVHRISLEFREARAIRAGATSAGIQQIHSGEHCRGNGQAGKSCRG